MMRARSRAAMLCLVGVLAAAVACGGPAGQPEPASQVPPAPDHLKNLHASDLTKGFAEQGLTCKAPQKERDTQHWVCESTTPIVQRLAEFYGKAPGRIEYIRVVVTQSGSPKLEMLGPLVGYVASLRYEGADPEAARAWAEKNLAAGGMTAVGPAKLKLSGDLSRLVFEMKAPGSEW
jgi:hypothetical protein